MLIELYPKEKIKLQGLRCQTLKKVLIQIEKGQL